MIELLKFVTSGFWVFLGSLIFTCGLISTTGWAVHAILLGLRGTHLHEGDES